MKISATTIYFTDNGMMLCGDHLGATAKATGRDLSGQRIEAATPDVARECVIGYGYLPACERCGRVAALPAGATLEQTLAEGR